MPKKIPERLCVACRSMKPKKSLIRLVISQDGVIALDPTGRKPGRGAYVCRSRSCLELALRGKKLDRGLKRPVTEEVLQLLIREMEAMPPDEQV